MEGEVLQQEPLERLPIHLNTVLVQIGRIFQHAVRSDPRTYNRARTQGHEAISKANRQFHEALDEFEIGLLQAKSVLERDLASLRAKRAEREHALRAERLRALGKENLGVKSGPAIRDNGQDIPIKVEGYDEAALLAADPTAKATAGLDSADIFARGSGPEPDTNIGNSQPRQNGPLGDPSQPDVATKADKEHTTQDLADLGVSADIFGESLASTDFANMSTDADFDSMFNDPTGNGADPLNYSLDFSVPGVPSNGVSAHGSGTGASAVDFVNLDVTSSEDINSLLPGLESYVNADGDTGIDDFAMIDVPNGELAGPTAEVQSSSTARQGTAVTSSMGDASASVGIDTNYDDIFGTDELPDVGETDDINFDDWFNN